VVIAEVALADAERPLGAHAPVGALVIRVLLRQSVVRRRLRLERLGCPPPVAERVLLALGPLQRELDRELVARLGVVGERPSVARVYREVEPAGRLIAVAAFEGFAFREIERDVVRVGVREVELRSPLVSPGVRLPNP
jgi:hypothetical protein